MSEIELSWSGPVAVVTLAAPERRNALTAEMARDLIAICESLDAGQHAAAVVLRGASGTFCAGADLALLARVAQDPADDERYSELDAVYQRLVALRRCARPRSPPYAVSPSGLA